MASIKYKIIKLFNKEDINITENNIKIWELETMRICDVIRGCKHVKSLNSPIVIYTNKVSNKSMLEKSEKVKIYDVEDLKELSLKQKNYKLYDLL